VPSLNVLFSKGNLLQYADWWRQGDKFRKTVGSSSTALLRDRHVLSHHDWSVLLFNVTYFSYPLIPFSPNWDQYRLAKWWINDDLFFRLESLQSNIVSCNKTMLKELSRSRKRGRGCSLSSTMKKKISEILRYIIPTIRIYQEKSLKTTNDKWRIHLGVRYCCDWLNSKSWTWGQIHTVEIYPLYFSPIRVYQCKGMWRMNEDPFIRIMIDKSITHTNSKMHNFH